MDRRKFLQSCVALSVVPLVDLPILPTKFPHNIIDSEFGQLQNVYITTSYPLDSLSVRGELTLVPHYYRSNTEIKYVFDKGSRLYKLRSGDVPEIMPHFGLTTPAQTSEWIVEFYKIAPKIDRLPTQCFSFRNGVFYLWGNSWGK